MKGIAVVSGGMDSVTLVHYLLNQGDDVDIVSFDYGQRHKKELHFAENLVGLNRGGNQVKHWSLIDLSSLTEHIGGSSLTDDSVDVPDGHYAEESMKATVVPNRNMIMLSIAAGIAVARGANYVSTAVHSGDHFIYPDCRPEFVERTASAIRVANEGFDSWSTIGPVYAPFMFKTKTDICLFGTALGVDHKYTWSCYKGGDIHCGRCGTCVERKEAFKLAGVVDPTEYEDAEFQISAFRG